MNEQSALAKAVRDHAHYWPCADACDELLLSGEALDQLRALAAQVPPSGKSMLQDIHRALAKEIIEEIGQAPPTIPTVEMVVTVLKALRGQSYCDADRIWAEAYVRGLSHPGITIGVTTFWYNAISSYPWGMQTKGGEPTHCGDMNALINACRTQHVYITDASFRAILALAPTP